MATAGTSNNPQQDPTDPSELTRIASDALRVELLREVEHVQTLFQTELTAAVKLIDEQFKVIESQRVEAKVDTKQALDKTEGAVDKLDEATRRDIEEIKERLGKIEQQYVTRDSVESRLSSIEFGVRRSPAP